MDVEHMLHGPSSNVESQVEVVTLLHDSMVKEHPVSACVSENSFSFALMRSHHSPLRYVLHASLQMDSEKTLFSLAFLVPVKYQFEVGSMSSFHGRHVSNHMIRPLVVVSDRHRMDILVSQVRHYTDHGNRGRLHKDDWLLNWLHHHYWFGLLHYYDRLLMDHGICSHHKETTVSFRPISEVEVVNMEYVLHRTSSDVVH